MNSNNSYINFKFRHFATFALTVFCILFLLAPTVAATDMGQVCDVLSTGRINVSGSIKTITVSAPEGKLISGYCVKAGSINQGFGPEYYRTVPVKTVTISHSSGKDISHYSLRYVDDTTTTSSSTITSSTSSTSSTSITSTSISSTSTTTTSTTSTTTSIIGTIPTTFVPVTITTIPVTTVTTSIPTTTVPEPTTSSKTTINITTTSIIDDNNSAVRVGVNELAETGNNIFVYVIIGYVFMLLGLAVFYIKNTKNG